jgi:hypothetical protein
VKQQLVHLWENGRAYSSVVKFRNDGSPGWDLIWSPCSTDWTWRYMGLGQDSGDRRTGLISHRGGNEEESAQHSTKNSENGLHDHTDARSCQWMVVIMEYDTADNGTYNPDRRRKNQERITRHTAPSQKKSVQTTRKPPAKTSVTSSTACQGVTWNRNETRAALSALFGVYYYYPYESQSFV